MSYDGPVDLGDKTVWFKNGAIHREDGPAIEFNDGRKLWALNGKEVTEQEAAACRQEFLRQARELSDKLWQSHQIEQIGQAFHKGLASDLPVKGPLKLKSGAEGA